MLEDWKERYAPSSLEEEWDDRFVEACQILDRVEYLVDVLTFEELEVRVKAVDMLKKDGTIDRLEERLNRLEKEERAYIVINEWPISGQNDMVKIYMHYKSTHEKFDRTAPDNK